MNTSITPEQARARRERFGDTNDSPFYTGGGLAHCHECGGAMTRDVRPRTITYKGHSEDVQMPGWYCGGCDESIHSGADMAVSGQAVRRLKAIAPATTLG